jgi:hypothetical protein
MEPLIESVRAALRDDAPAAVRSEGLTACRKILAALEATIATDDEPAAPPIQAAAPEPPTPQAQGVPAATPSPPVSSSPAPAIDPAAITTLIASLGKLPPEQLLDLAIARLRAALPAGASVPAPTPLRFQLVPLHHLRTSK